MAKHNDIGRQGEEIAKEHLQKSGYNIVCTNWKCRSGEIDIIASDNNFMVFTEVKSRSSEYWGNPSDAVTPNKIKRIVCAADEYIDQNDLSLPARFDVIEVLIKSDRIDIRHIEDAFVAPLN